MLLHDYDYDPVMDDAAEHVREMYNTPDAGCMSDDVHALVRALCADDVDWVDVADHIAEIHGYAKALDEISECSADDLDDELITKMILKRGGKS